MTNDITYESISKLQPYIDKIKNVAQSIDNNYALTDDVTLASVDFQEKNEMIRKKFFEGYNYARRIFNSNSSKLKSELEDMIKDIPREELLIASYGNPNIVDANEFKKDLFKAYIGGAYIAFRNPVLSEKERHEALIKMSS